MDNLINAKSVKNRINAINTKLSDNAKYINNTNNLIPNTIVIYGDSVKYYIIETYDDLSRKELNINNLDEYLNKIKDIQLKNKIKEPTIIKVVSEQEWCD